MSELKRHHINEVMDMHNLTRGKMGYSFVYYADEADKVIAEKEKELRHHKFKRCLAMAKWCEAENYTECWYHENSERCEWTEKWHKRWLELAEKFKEAK